jgi:hypothetical protein
MSVPAEKLKRLVWQAGELLPVRKPVKLAWAPAEVRLAWAPAEEIELGDDVGHDFHGNQWTGGIGGGSMPPTKASGGGVPDPKASGYDLIQQSAAALWKPEDHAGMSRAEYYGPGSSLGVDATSDTDVRSAMKALIVEDIANRTQETAIQLGGTADDGLSEDRVNQLTHAWASSSTQDPDSIACQVAIAEKFGFEPTPYIKDLVGQQLGSAFPEATDEWKKEGADAWAERMSDAQQYVDAAYAATQEKLAAAGIDSLTLYRGEHYSAQETPPGGLDKISTNTVQEGDLSTNPMTSWSSSPATALNFGAAGGAGYLFKADIPASRIVSSCLTGQGCLSETEWIVADGGSMEATVARGASWDDLETLDPGGAGRGVSEMYKLAYGPTGRPA